MDENDRRVLNRAMSDFVSELRVTSRFKAHLMSSELVSDEDLEEVTRVQTDPEEIAFDLLQLLKKSSGASVDSFSDVLRQSGQGELADKLIGYRDEMGLSGASAGEASSSGQRQDRNLDSPEDVVKDVRTAMDEDRSVERGAEPDTPACHHLSLEDQQQCLVLYVETLYEHGQEGDVVVPRPYKDKARRFAGGRSNTYPGPLPEIQDRTSYPSSEYTGINPSCALELSRLYGGKVQLLRTTRHNCKIMVTPEGEVRYVLMGICIKPRGTELKSWWLSATATMETAIAASIGCIPSQVKKHNADEVSDTYAVDFKVKLWMEMEGPGNIDVWL